MAQDLKLKIKGLYTSYNDLSEVPEGALVQARNIDILQDSLATPRRGFDRLAGNFQASDERALQLELFDDAILFGKSLIAYTDDEKLYYYNEGLEIWVQIGGTTYPQPDSSTRLRFSKSNQNLYYTTSEGVYKFDSVLNNPKIAGVPKALDLKLEVLSTSATWFADKYRVAYRAILGYRDANDNLLLGAPSQRSSIKNTTGVASDTTITTPLPAGLDTDYFIQIYRSGQVDNSATATEPSDEMQLVYEANLTSGEISAGQVVINDIASDDIRGATIYTAGSQQGISQANERPPLCKDMAVFKGHTFYLNVEFIHRYLFTVISAANLAVGETITIDSVVYTAAATENAAAGQFFKPTTGSIAEQIRTLSESLVRVINAYASSTVYAFYISDPKGLPGRILIEDRELGTSGFAVRSNSVGVWTSPDLPTSGSAQSSSNDEARNGLAFSKQDQPEAVPLTNIFFPGSADEAGRRVISLKDSCFILKDDGIYKVYGQNASDFSLVEFDKTVQILCPESAVVLANTIFCLTDQGVVSISETGVSIRSRPIEQDLLALIASSSGTVFTQGFGVAFNEDRKYYLFLPSTDGDTYPTQSFVYNIFTDTWVRHTLPARCGYVTGAGELYLGSATDNYLLKERRSYDYTDFVDHGFDANITDISGDTITLDTGIADLAVGDILQETDALFATIISIDEVTGTFDVNTDPGFSTSAVSILKAIDTEIQWAPVTTGNAGVQKQFYSAKLLFKTQFIGEGQMTFETGMSASKEGVQIDGGSSAFWGLEPWGEFIWGGDLQRKENRQWPPRSKQRASQILIGFTHKYGYSAWELVGVTLFSTMGSGETVR